jgi:hypothetical protein
MLAMTPALALETSFGLQGQIFRPVGAFAAQERLNRDFGFGAGFHVPIDFGAGQVLRPRFDYLDLRRDSDGIRYRTASMILSVDYTHFFEGVREGAYFIGGLGLHSTSRDVTRPFTRVASSKGSATGLYYNVGLGYAPKPNFGLELTYVGLDMPPVHFPGANPSDPRFMGNGLAATVSFTF